MFNKFFENNVPVNQQEGLRKVHYLSICVCGKDDQRYSFVFNVKIFICFLISACHLTFTIIFYYHAVMNTFIQWQETISDAYFTDTDSFVFSIN